MKRIISIAILLLTISVYASAQDSSQVVVPDSNVEKPVLTPKDSLFLNYLDLYRQQLREPKYKLYKTNNTWTLLKLDTETGQIWQVQYSVDSSPRMEYPLDIEVKLYSWHERICGRFELYETHNMYNFILIDTIDGRCWQVQWNIDDNKRWARRIY
ncbi:MAG: hypothetical protein J5498_03015 [Bacteroidales bacterium]|nr:hypothetical protein [Bacteroidales bacterium]